MDFETLTYKEELRYLYKKYKTKGQPIYVMRHRVFNSSIGILKIIESISFADLSWDLYFLIEDTEFSEIANMYKTVLETAKMQPQKFIRQLYEFYSKTAKKIKDRGLVKQFFDFLSLLLTYTQDTLIAKRNPVKHQVYVAYMNLLLEQTEFLRSNIFDYDKVIVGIDTKGKTMEVNDVAVNLDIFCYDLEETVLAKGDIEAVQRRYNMDIVTMSNLLQQCQNFNNNIYVMTPYINEYTMDIVPMNFISNDIEPIMDTVPVVKKTVDIEQLCKKRRTLPTNGLNITIGENSFVNKLLLREIIYQGEVVVLYKATTSLGETSGFYRKSNDVFYSMFGHSGNEYIMPLDDVLKNIVLWAYTSYVCSEKVTLNTEYYLEYFRDHTRPKISFIAKSGKLRVPSSGIPKQMIAYQDGYETEIRYIAGYIRKLPAGQTPSQKAIDAARALGYELSVDETYVCPFERSAWVKIKT